MIQTLIPPAKTGGRPLTVDMRVVTAANLPERAGAKLVFAQVKKEQTKF